MAKVELKGYVLIVNQPEEVGEKKTKKQTVILKVPAYRDEFGDTKGQDEEWPLDIMGDNVAKFNLTTEAQGKRAKCTVYVNGNKFIKKSDNTEGWTINARLGAIDLLAEGQPANTPVTNQTAGKAW